MDELRIEIEQLEDKIAPSVAPGQLGYEGQPGNQGNGLQGRPRKPAGRRQRSNGELVFEALILDSVSNARCSSKDLER